MTFKDFKEKTKADIAVMQQRTFRDFTKKEILFMEIVMIWW